MRSNKSPKRTFSLDSRPVFCYSREVGDIKMQIELNKVYEFDLGDMSHCGRNHQEMIEHYKSNSSPLSFLTEKLLSGWFDNLVYDSTPHKIECGGAPINIKPDLRDKETGTLLYDQKAFNHKGGSFLRSSMKGVGREKNQELFAAWALAQSFIWTDFCNLPVVRVIAISGKECLKRFPTGKIPFKARQVLFREVTTRGN